MTKRSKNRKYEPETVYEYLQRNSDLRCDHVLLRIDATI